MKDKPIRVLVVDDSPTIRGALIDALEAEVGFVVVGEGHNGDDALRLCERLRPDVVTLDMAMPRLSGLEATRAIMASCPTPILIVSASVNRGEALHTYDALAAGAVDVHDKSRALGRDGPWQAEFVDRVRMVAGVSVMRRRGPSVVQVPDLPPPVLTSRRLVRTGAPDVAPALWVLGASTGGPGALATVLRALPAPLTVPVAVVQHVSEVFAESFRAWLDQQLPHPVRHVDGKIHLGAAVGGIWLAPPDRHLVVEHGLLRAVAGPELHSCRPSVDVLFHSAAALGPAVAAVLLTGMGRDGAAGMRAIRDAGGLTIAQDAATSVIHGMPGAAILLDAAVRVCPLEEVAAALLATLPKNAHSREELAR